MTTSIVRKPKLVQMYDRVKVREYFKLMSGFIFSWEEKLHTETIETSNILVLEAEKLPDEVYFNGKPYKLTPKTL